MPTIQIHPNKEMRSYYTRVELSDSWELAERGFSLPDSTLLRMILGIRGVQKLMAAGYELTITKGGAFSWEEIEPEIIEILEGLEGSQESAK